MIDKDIYKILVSYMFTPIIFVLILVLFGALPFIDGTKLTDITIFLTKLFGVTFFSGLIVLLLDIIFLDKKKSNGEKIPDSSILYLLASLFTIISLFTVYINEAWNILPFLLLMTVVIIGFLVNIMIFKKRNSVDAISLIIGLFSLLIQFLLYLS